MHTYISDERVDRILSPNLAGERISDERTESGRTGSM